MHKEFSLKDLNFTQSIIHDFLNSEASVLDMQEFQPSIKGILEASSKKVFNSQERSSLTLELSQQLEELGDQPFSEIVNKNIQQLKSQNTFTITTGQQLHPFLGPSYVVVKILESIQLCRHLNNHQNQFKYVPVFWLASEDHDTEEISQTSLFNQQFNFKFPKNITTGKIPCELLKPTITQIEERLGNEADISDFFQVCKRAYSQCKNLSMATCQIVYELFAKNGIIVIDADKENLKSRFKYIVEDELQNMSTTSIQSNTKKVFNRNNWHYQVMPRTNNLFEIREDTYERIASVDTSFNKLKNYSPNALLRPLYQEVTLPNVCYVGGLAEVNYWLQLKNVFEHHSVQMPVIWARNSYYVGARKKLELLLKPTADYDVPKLNEQDYKLAYLEANKTRRLEFQFTELVNQIETKSKDYQSEEWNELFEALQKCLKKLKMLERDEKNSILSSEAFKNSWKSIFKSYLTLFDKNEFQERNKSVLELDLNYSFIDTLQKQIFNTEPHLGSYHLIGI